MADIEHVIASLERLHNRVSTLEAVPHGPISENANDYSDSDSDSDSSSDSSSDSDSNSDSDSDRDSKHRRKKHNTKKNRFLPGY